MFRLLFDSCSQHFDARNTYSDVFLMSFVDFGRFQLLGSVNRACTSAQEPKKVKITKNELKQPQTIIKCHIKMFGIDTIGPAHHMCQFIVTDLQVV